MKKITVLLADDHRLILDAWKLIINSNDKYHVVSSNSTAEQAIEEAGKLKPDIVLMDINLPGMNGVDAIPLLRKCSPDSSVVAVSAFSLPVYARRTMQYGASAYITKNSPSEELFYALSEVCMGRKYICSEIKDIYSSQTLMNEEANLFDLLSKRELEVINLIRQGYKSKEIADILLIHFRTVEVHRYNILKKLKMKNTVALVNFVNENCVSFSKAG